MKLNKVISTLLCFSMISAVLPLKAYAGKAEVSTDEAVYANLDYYGDLTDLSVVKGVSLNGINKFTDYGEYDKVTNMSGHSNPEMEDGSVTWNLSDEGSKRFYYECVPTDKDSIAIPWKFDVSYKLNGVPTDADELRGKAGLVEINIKAKPNENIPEYYKNNILLQVVSLVDMEKTLSIEAPGAQLQSIGTYKAVLFLALPGEEGDFTIRIGTDSFESTGIEMTMIPGTSDSLKKIKELKEVKDDVKDSFDSINESLDSVFKTFGSMSTNLSSLKKELNSLNDVINTMSNSKDEINGDTDELIDKLNGLSSEISNMTPYFSRAVQCISETNNDINSVVNSLVELRGQISTYKEDLTKVRNILNEIEEGIDNTQKVNNSMIAALGELRDDIDKVEDEEKQLKKSISDMNSSLSSLKTQLETTKSTLQYMARLSTDPSTVQMLTLAASNIDSIANTITEIESLSREVGDAIRVAEYFNDDTREILDLSQEYVDLLNTQSNNADNFIDITNKLINEVKRTLSTADELIGKVQGLNDTCNKYYKDSIDMVNDGEKLTNGINEAVNSTSTLIEAVEKVIKDNQDNLKDSRNGSVQSVISLLDKTIDLSNDSGLLNQSNNTIHDAINNQLDKTEEDSNILNLDYETGFISFTSDKNPAPESVQIILRTKEITLDDDDDGNNDLEREEEDEGILNRIVNIFKKLATCFE